MKQIRNMSAMILSAGVLLSAMPILPVYAEEAAAPVEETVEMTATVKLNDTAATAEGKNITIDGTKITISASGAYEFSGKLSDGQIIVNVADTTADAETVKLYFNGVNITGKTAAAVYVVNAKNTSINLMDGTENFLLLRFSGNVVPRGILLQEPGDLAFCHRRGKTGFFNLQQLLNILSGCICQQFDIPHAFSVPLPMFLRRLPPP